MPQKRLLVSTHCGQSGFKALGFAHRTTHRRAPIDSRQRRPATITKEQRDARRSHAVTLGTRGPRMGSNSTPLPKRCRCRRGRFGSTMPLRGASDAPPAVQAVSRSSARSGLKRSRARGPAPRRTAPSSSLCSYTYARETPRKPARTEASTRLCVGFAAFPSASRGLWRFGSAVVARPLPRSAVWP
jgi:hypothetical protein